MILREPIFLEYPVGVQPFGCQIKAPVSMTKCSPFRSSPSHRGLQSPSCMCVCVRACCVCVCVFLPPNLLYTMDFGGRLSVLFAVNFCRLRRASSPWIFILPLTPLNVNSSFPVLLFISVAGWFDHAGNTRLAIALSLVLPQGHLLLKCYCLCFLTLCAPLPFSPLIFHCRFSASSLFPLSLMPSSFTALPENRGKNHQRGRSTITKKRKRKKCSHLLYHSAANFLICLCTRAFDWTCRLTRHIINLR